METAGVYHQQDIGPRSPKEREKNIVGRVAAFFGEATAEQVGKAAPGIQKLLTEKWDRLVTAGNLSLFRYSFSMGINVDDLESMAQMSDENFSFLESLAHRYGGENLVVLSKGGILETILKNPHLRRACEAFLEQAPENLDCISLMIDTEYEDLLKTEEGMKRFEEGLETLSRWKNLFGSEMGFLSNYEFTWLIMKSERKDIERLEREIKDADAARIFGEYLLQERRFMAGELMTEYFWKRIELYKGLLTSENVSKAGDSEYAYREMVQLFVMSRSSFLEAILENISVEQFTSHYGSMKAIDSFLKTAEACDLENISRVNEEKLQAWKNRERTPINCSEEQMKEDGAALILEDILCVSGMDEVARQYIGSIEVKMKEDNAAGRCNRETNRILMYYGHDSFKNTDIPATLFHEMGHAVNFAMKAIPNGQSLFDKYAIKAVYFGPHVVSEYPEAVAIMEGRETESYLVEAFAEDFRALVEYPPIIPFQRRQVLEELWEEVLPKVSLEKIREKTRNMYAAFYGVNAGDLQSPDACEVSKNFANYMARADDEDAREEKN